MFRIKAALLSLLLLVPSGCAHWGCEPKELFSWIDRNCFVADWTNHHSCVSCCCGKNGCSHRPVSEYPMLVLGNQENVEPTDAEQSAAPANPFR